MAISHVLFLDGSPPYSADPETVRIAQRVPDTAEQLKPTGTVVQLNPATTVGSAQRVPNTTADGEPFDESTINAVWEKAYKEWGFYYYRKDPYGTSIAWQDYGKKTRYGWEIDHIVPISAGGTDDLDNLQPVHWENNIEKGDAHPHWTPPEKE